GPLVQQREGQGKLKDKTGFYAWFTAREAAAVDEAEDVKSVVPVGPDDKAGPGRRRGSRELTVHLGPNSWDMKGDEKTFETTKEIAEQLQDELKANVKIMALGTGNLMVGLADPDKSDAVVKA